MPTLRSIQGSGIVTFDSFYLPLDLPGVTTIRGDNRDSKQKDDTNGVGKTLLFGCLKGVLYAEGINAVRRNSIKTLLGTSGSLTHVLENNGDTFRIGASAKGNSVKWEMTKNDEPLAKHTNKSVQEVIRECFPLTMDQYSSTVFLNAFANNKLNRGSGTDRMAILENLFLLESHELMREEIKKQQMTARVATASVKALEAEIESLGEEEDEKALKESLVTARSRLKKVQRMNDSLIESYTRLESAISLGRRIGDTLIRKQSVVNKEISKTEKLVSELDQMLRKAERLSEQWDNYAKSKKKQSTIREKLDKLPEVKAEKFDPDEARAIGNELIRKVKKFKENKKDIEAWQAVDVKKWAKQLGINKFSFDALAEKSATLRAELTTSRRHLSFHEKGKATCDECGSIVDPKSRKKAVSTLSARVKEIESLLVRCRDMQALEDAHDLAEEFADFDLEKAVTGIKRLSKQLKQYKADQESIQERKRLKSLLEEVSIDKPKTRPSDTTSLEAEKSKLQSLLEKLRSEKSLGEQLESLGLTLEDIRTASSSMSLLVKKRSRVSKKLETLQDKFSKLESKLCLAKERNARRKKLASDLAKAEKTAGAVKILDMLSEAYGPRGLLVFLILEIAHQYVDNLNRLAPDFFGEPFKFDVDMRGRDLSIIAERNNGICSDVRELSGFEARGFGVSSVVSLLPLLSPQYRTNILVLDEMETGLSPPNRARFAHDLIPRITDHIPSVYVLTANSKEQFYIPDSRELTVVKEKYKSRIEGL